MRMLTVAGLVIVVGLASGRIQAQTGSNSGGLRPPNQSGGLGHTGIGDAEESSDAAYRRGIQEKQEKARNDERQKRLVADTEKLLALATQLHDDVGKTDKNILSLDVVKRSEEIEKLARTIKERMRN